MATTSLGRLTLDLAVRLSDFTDGLTQAERQARDSARNIGGSVRELRDNIADDISKISGSFAGMAIGGLAVSTGALVAMTIEAAKADVQLGIMAGTANTGLKSFQVLTHAAAGFGVEQEALAAILADTQEKLGEFSATGGGGAADFFEALQNNTEMTDEQIRKLGKTLQGKDGVEAIQYLKDELDAMGATSQEQRFVMESLAGDLGNLMPLFANGGQTLKDYGKELEDAGVIKSKDAIDQSRILAAETQAIQTKFEGVKTQLVAEMIPALGTLITHFTDGKVEGKGFRTEVDNVGKAIRGTTSLVVGLAAGVSVIATSFQTVGAQMRMIGQTSNAFFAADGVMAKGAALAAGFVGTAGVTTVGLKSITEQYEDAISTIDKLMAGHKNRLSDLGQVYYDSNTFLQSNTDGLAINTVEAEENAKAKEKQAAAEKKLAEERKKAAAAQSRLVGISGDTGIGNAHLHVQYRDKSRPVSTTDLARFQAGGKSIESYGKTSGYGPRNTGIKGASTFHRGTDFGLPKNTPITTSVPVKNVKTWLDKKGGGYVSTITFGDGVVIDLLHQMPSIMALDKGETTGNSQIDGAIKKADAMWQKSATDAARAQEEQERKQLSVATKWANDKEKIELTYQSNIAEIKEAHAEGSTDYIKYMARAEEDYAKAKNAGLLSITEKYFSEEQKIHDDHRKAIAAIEKEFVEKDPNRTLFVDLQNAAYQEDLANFKFASGAKARAQDKMYQSIANSARANSTAAVGTGLDSMAQRTMSDNDYAIWRLGQDHDEAYNSVNDQYTNRQAEINAVDERGNFALPELERFELLEIAKQEHLDKMWAMEQEYALKDQMLAEQQTSQRVAIYQGLFAGMTDAASVFFGESSRMHKAAFALEKGYAVYTALMNVETTRSKTFDALSGIPLIGPYIAGPGSIAAAALQVATAANIQGMSAPSVAGIAHGGLDNVPAEATYLLQKDERVLSPKQNKDLTKYLGESRKARGGDITINNNSSAEVSARRNDDGSVSIEMVDKMIKRSFGRIADSNSFESKQIQRHTTARVKR